MDSISPSNGSAVPSSPQITAPPPISPDLTSNSAGPIVVTSVAQNQPTKHVLPIFIVSAIVLLLIGFIIFKVYEPDLRQVSQMFMPVTPSSSPNTSISASSPTPKPNTTIEALRNAFRVMDEVDFNSEAIYKSSVYYSYSAKVAVLTNDTNGQIEITTDTSIPGLPKTWKYNGLTDTFALSDKDEFGKSDAALLKEGGNVQINGSFVISSKEKEIIPDKFNLDSVTILPTSRKLTTMASPLPSFAPIIEEKITYPIQNLLTKNAFYNAKKTMSQVSLNTKESEAGLLFKYSGKIVDIKTETDGSKTLITDTKVPGIPNTWEINDQSLVFALGKSTKLEQSELQVGRNVRIAANFIIQTGWEEAYPQNQFVLSSIGVEK